LKKKGILICLIAALIIGMTGVAWAAQEVKNPDTYIGAYIGGVHTLDPARAYDTASAEVIYHIYEPLIFWDGGETDKFVPVLATKVPSLENGLISDDGLTYTFPVRKGVKFHNGEVMTPEDVEYSFERAMVQDMDASPLWMIYEPLLGVSGSRDAEGNIVVNFEDIDKAVEIVGDNVVFHLKKPYPPFLAILANNWSSIVCKKFCIENGDWPGTAENWKEYNNPAMGTQTLHKIACGTGPFMLERWEPNVETVLVRNDNYWREPAKFKRIVRKVVEEWTTRKLMFLAGDVDNIDVPRPNIEELEGVEGIRVHKDLPSLILDSVFFNFKINPEGNTDIGSGKLDGNGIPPDFFSNKDVRLGFAYSFDWDTFIRDAWLGEATKPRGPIIEGLPYLNPEQEVYYFDPKKAEEHFKKAWNGEVWEKGFKLTVLYNTGNIPRQIAASIFKDNVEALNPEKFKIEVRPVEWPTYLDLLTAHKLTMFIIGWLADYPDPHNFIFTYIHSSGDYAKFQSYGSPLVDELVKRGIETVEPKERERIYKELQIIYYDDIPSIGLDQRLLRQYERDWVKGWYYNPMFPNCDTGGYLYQQSKGY